MSRKNTFAFWLAMVVIIACFIYTQAQSASNPEIEIETMQGERPHDYINRLHKEGARVLIEPSEMRCVSTYFVDAYIEAEGYYLASSSGEKTEAWKHSDGRHFTIYRDLGPNLSCLLDWGF